MKLNIFSSIGQECDRTRFNNLGRFYPCRFLVSLVTRKLCNGVLIDVPHIFRPHLELPLKCLVGCVHRGPFDFLRGPMEAQRLIRGVSRATIKVNILYSQFTTGFHPPFTEILFSIRSIGNNATFALFMSKKWQGREGKIA